MEPEETGAPESLPNLAHFIRERRAEILGRWEGLARRSSAGRDLSRSHLIDHLPQLLSRISQIMEGDPAGTSTSPCDASEEHADTRLDEGYDVVDVTAEYAALRRTVLDLFEERVSPNVSIAEVRRFDAAIDESILLSVGTFFRTRERTLIALERIAEAARVSGGTEEFLPHLLRVLLETTLCVDTVAVLLEENGTLRIRAAVGLEEELESGFSVCVGEGFSGTIAETRAPLESRHAAEDPAVRSPFIRARQVKALYGVPMLHGDRLVGVAHMGSRTAHEFSRADKLVFRTMVSRATEILMHSELARKERAARTDAEKAVAQMDALIEAAPVSIAILDTGLRYVRVNDAMARHNGTSPEAHVGRTVQEVLGEIAAPIEPLLRRILETGHPVRDFAFAAPSQATGETREWLAQFFPIQNDGELLGVGGVVVDVSDVAHVNAERARLLVALERHRRLLDAVVTQLPVGVVLAEAPGGKLLLGNEAFERILRGAFVPAASVDEYRAYGAFRMDGTPLDPADRPLARAVRGEVVPGEEIILERADGTRAITWQSALPIRDGDAGVMAAVVTILDITDRTRAEDDLRRAAQFRETFLGIVSHDLRNPLNAISASAQFLLRDETLRPSHTRTIVRISHAAERMARMIRDLLDFTAGRLGSGLPVVIRRLDLRELCCAVVDELEVHHPTRRIHLDMSGDLIGAFDPDRMSQLLGNLGKNALDYSPEGAQVSISARGDADHITLEVHNDGPPIPADKQASLFEPFRQGNRPDRRQGGLGLGLYIVHQIVLAHCGTIEVCSDEGVGTTFTVKLPRGACPS